MAFSPRFGEEVWNDIFQTIPDPQLRQEVENFRLNICNAPYTRRRIRKLRRRDLRKIYRQMRTSDQYLFQKYTDLCGRGEIDKNTHQMSAKQLYPCK